MRWKTAVLTLACIAFMSGTSHAEMNWVGLEGGISSPTGDFGDFAKMGFEFGGSGTWMFTPMWGAGVDVGYHMWNGSDDYNTFLSDEATADAGTPTTVEAKFSAIQATGHAMLMFPSSGTVHPWAKAGVGIYNFKAKSTSDNSAYEGDVSSSDMGFTIGAGVNMASGPSMSYGIGAAFHQIQSDPDATNLYTVNLNVRFGMGGPQ